MEQNTEHKEILINFAQWLNINTGLEIDEHGNCVFFNFSDNKTYNSTGIVEQYLNDTEI